MPCVGILGIRPRPRSPGCSPVPPAYPKGGPPHSRIGGRMPRTVLSALVALVAALPALAADEAYTLKLYKDREGDVTKKTKVSKSDGSVAFALGDMKGDQ